MAMTISGDNGLTFPAGSTQVQAGNYQTMVNRIINGRMEIDQRNAGASVTQDTTGTQYCLDRWLIYGNVASKFTAQQNAGSVTPPAGFRNYLGITSSSAYSVGAGDVFQLAQFIEGFNTADLNWGTANAQTVTLSFWVRSSLTGTFGGSFVNSAIDRSYPFSYTISSANTWEQKSITVAGDTTGTWVGATNGVGVRVYFGLGVGSTNSGTAGAWANGLFRSATGATSVVGTNGATFYITGVDLRVGSYTVVPQDFRAYGTELALCQRYYQKTYSPSTVPGTNTDLGTKSSIAYSTANTAGGFYLQTPMRAVPTFTLYSGIGTSGVWTATGGVNTAAASIYGQNENGFLVISSSGLTSGQVYYGHWVASAEL